MPSRLQDSYLPVPRYGDALALPRVSHTRMLLMGDPGYLKAETYVPTDILLLTVEALRVKSCLFYFALYPIPDLGVWHMLGSQSIDIDT